MLMCWLPLALFTAATALLFTLPTLPAGPTGSRVPVFQLPAEPMPATPVSRRKSGRALPELPPGLLNATLLVPRAVFPKVSSCLASLPTSQRWALC